MNAEAKIWTSAVWWTTLSTTLAMFKALVDSIEYSRGYDQGIGAQI